MAAINTRVLRRSHAPDAYPLQYPARGAWPIGETGMPLTALPPLATPASGKGKIPRLSLGHERVGVPAQEEKHNMRSISPRAIALACLIFTWAIYSLAALSLL